MTQVHSTAVVDAGAELGEGVEIGPYSVVGPNVKIGAGTSLMSHVVLDGFTTIGCESQIFPFASIGTQTQDLKFKGEKTYVRIGAGTVVREFVTINRGTEFGGGVTDIGPENFLMAYSHVAHDCKTGRCVIMANNATLAGHIEIGDYVTVGGLVAGWAGFC